jgi:hypothetical protein
MEGHGLLLLPLSSEPLRNDAVRGVVPIVFLMTCKPLSGLIHWVEEPNALLAKRLMIDWAALEQLISFVLAVAAGWEFVFDDPRMMRWVPTQFQSAGIPIQVETDVQTWWDMLRNPQLSHFCLKVNFKRSTVQVPWICGSRPTDFASWKSTWRLEAAVSLQHLHSFDLLVAPSSSTSSHW